MGKITGSVTAKIVTVVIAAALVPCVLVAVLSYNSASSTLEYKVFAKLEALTEARASEIERYSETIREQMVTFAHRSDVISGVQDFDAAYDLAGPAALQELYIGTLGETDDAGDGSEWSELHARLHPGFREYQQEFGYYDVFLFDLDGNLVYSVFKEPDFATNVIDGEFADSGIGDVFRSALQTDDTAWEDFAPYAPSAGAQAAFASHIIKDEAGTSVGVAVFQMPVDRLNSVMQSAVGLGDTGETFLVGADGTFRSDSRFSEESVIGVVAVDTPSVAAAQAGESGVHVVDSHEGVEVLSSYRPVEVFGQQWVVLGEQTTSESLAAVGSLRNLMIVVTLAAVALAVAGAVWFARRFARPIVEVAEAARVLSTGDTEVSLPSAGDDEIGELVRSASASADYLRASASLAEEVAGGNLDVDVPVQGDRDRLGLSMQRMVDGLRSVVEEARSVSDSVADASSSVSMTAGESAAAATEVANAIGTVAESSTAQAEITDRLQDRVAEITSEVAGALTAIERVDEAAGSARADTEAGNALIQQGAAAMDAITAAFAAVGTSIEEVAEKSSHVEEATGLIADITEQINLLALNAAIEAARAGEAGRGFAVVAAEVKNLADQSRTSTDRISQIVDSMRSGVDGAVAAATKGREAVGQGAEKMGAASDAFAAIGAGVSNIDERVQDVSSAAGRIETATTEIAGQSSELASLTSSNGAVAEEVAASSEQASASAETMNETAGGLSEDVGRLRESLSRFQL